MQALTTLTRQVWQTKEPTWMHAIARHRGRGVAYARIVFGAACVLSFARHGRAALPPKTDKPAVVRPAALRPVGAAPAASGMRGPPVAAAGTAHLPTGLMPGYRLGSVPLNGVHLPSSVATRLYRPEAAPLPAASSQSSARLSLPRQQGPAPTAFRQRPVGVSEEPNRSALRVPDRSDHPADHVAAGPVGGLGARPLVRAASLTPPAGRVRPIVPRDPLRDPRLGRDPDRAVIGLAAGYAVARSSRPFLNIPDHRDVVADRGFVAEHAHDFHAVDVRDMDPRERALWRAGLWRNEWHYGRRGWWWEAHDAWYPYADPVFPYPPVVSTQVVYETPTVDGFDLAPVEALDRTPASGGAVAGNPAEGGRPDVAAGQVAEVAADVPPLPPAPTGWYRCDQPDGYYPSEGACGRRWALVQVAPLPGE